MTAQYDIRSEINGWTVFDIRTGSPAMINDVSQLAFPSKTPTTWPTC
jgi:hypothetical protein